MVRRRAAPSGTMGPRLPTRSLPSASPAGPFFIGKIKYRERGRKRMAMQAPADRAPLSPTPPVQAVAAKTPWRLGAASAAVLVAIGFVVTATGQWNSWVGSATIQTTNDAYVQADLTRLSTRVAGEILNVAVNDFQRVKAGDLLVQIDPADYEAQVALAEAGVAAAQAALDNLANQVELQYATIAQSEAQRLSAQAQEVETR